MPSLAISFARGKKLKATETSCQIYSFSKMLVCVSYCFYYHYHYFLHFSATRQNMDKTNFKLPTSDRSAKRIPFYDMRDDLCE